VNIMTWDDYNDGWGMHDGAGWGLLMVGLMLLLFAVVAVALVVLLVRNPGGVDRRPGPEAGASEAQRILQQRFARGEIDEEEFRTRRTALADDS